MSKDPNSQTIDTYNQIAAEYAQRTFEYITIPEIEKYLTLLPENAYVLEVGCGNGRDAAYMMKHGVQVLATDLSEELLKQAAKLNPQVKIQLQDMRSLEFENETFDGLWANATLLHLELKDVPKTLQGFNRVLKKKGTIFIKVKLGSGESFVTEKHSSDQPRFFTYYSKSQLEKLLTEAEFSIVDSYIFNAKDRRPESRDIDWLVVFARKA